MPDKKSTRNMSYSSNILNYIVKIKNKKDPSKLAFGEKTTYEEVAQVHSDMSWKRGQKALNEGALDNQDTVMFRMRWNPFVTRDSLLECEGVTYQIKDLHANRRENTIQITATEIITGTNKPTPSISELRGRRNYGEI